MSAPIATDLGRIAVPARGAPFDDIRFGLLDRLIAANGAGKLTPPEWEAAFATSVEALRARVLADAEGELRAAARISHYPGRKLVVLLPGADHADALLQRFLAAGMGLERLATLADDPAGRRARGAALDHAWDESLQVATAERARWQLVARRVQEWRRPLVPLWGACAAMLAISLLAAGWLSGEVPAPAWFAPINDLWWRLWP